ncbi:MAG: sortase-like acyltransferase [Solirubrobacterales bacterium]|nr:sortase-like acyltransferase [Solirubrobacterales bacterium]
MQTIDARTSRLVVRPATHEDAESCARIFYEAFESLATRHGFPIEPGSPDFTRFHVGAMLANDGIAGVVAERDGEVLGSAFVDERSAIAGIGPVTVDPAVQDDGVGRALMEALRHRERERGVAGVRLVQTAYHYRSLALYTKLGFVVREPLSVLQGTPPSLSLPGLGVRPAREDDVAACAELCARVHGHDRTDEVRAAVAAGTARVVARPERVAGYATGFGYGWHAVAETNEDLIALLSSAESFMGLGILVPSRNAELLGWCLGHGLRIVQQSTLMTIGLYNEPAGAWLPSIVY